MDLETVDVIACILKWLALNCWMQRVVAQLCDSLVVGDSACREAIVPVVPQVAVNIRSLSSAGLDSTAKHAAACDFLPDGHVAIAD